MPAVEVFWIFFLIGVVVFIVSLAIYWFWISTKKDRLERQMSQDEERDALVDNMEETKDEAPEMGM